MSAVQDLPAPSGRRGGAFRLRVSELSARHRSMSIIVGMAIVAAVLPVLAAVPPFSSFQTQNAWVDGFTNAGVFVLLALGLNLVVGVAGLLARTVVRPVRDLKAGVEAIARGNFTYPIAVETQDEIGALYREVTTAADELVLTEALIAESLRRGKAAERAVEDDAGDPVAIGLEQVLDGVGHHRHMAELDQEFSLAAGREVGRRKPGAAACRWRPWGFHPGTALSWAP